MQNRGGEQIGVPVPKINKGHRGNDSCAAGAQGIVEMTQRALHEREGVVERIGCVPVPEIKEDVVDGIHVIPQEPLKKRVRDRELADVRSQLAELQTLCDEVSHQLYTECNRIEGVQETVNACVKQSKELEAIHHKLEESPQMLLQMRDTRAW